jgi:hypothetical protein
MDTGVDRYESEQEERRAREIGVAREKERQWGSGG